jgi:hypothetical protein
VSPSRRVDAGLLHPVSLAAIALLVLNDHVLKPRFPGLVTGKLSDVAGLVFFPLLLSALLSRVPGARAVAPARLLAACVVATAIAFALVKTWAPATRAYEIGLGLLQWPFRVAGALARGEAPGGPRPVLLVRDPTDLVALPFVLVSLWIARKR